MREYLIFHTAALGIGILLDLLIGDPHALPHPVRAIGRLISFLEERLYDPGKGMAESRKGIDESRKGMDEYRKGMDGSRKTMNDPRKAKVRGTILWVTVVATVMLVTGLLLSAAYLLSPYAGVAAEAICSAYALAARSLCKESMKVAAALKAGDLPGARRALSMIVGRDTYSLPEDEVIKAAVETVAENTSDGVIAPFLYLALGGPIAGFFYKAVNTMDSMLGYRNERYEFFGRTAARADDVMNYLPARSSAVLMILASYVTGFFCGSVSGKNALRIWQRDRRGHLSPNSAQTESVCAGALGLRLGGTHAYQGVMVEKPVIGDERRSPEIRDIKRANGLMFGTELLCAGIVFAILILLMTR